MADGCIDDNLTVVVFPDGTEATLEAAAAACETVDGSTESPLPQELSEQMSTDDVPEEQSEPEVKAARVPQWTYDAVCFLIEMYKNYMEMFKGPDVKKMDVWKKIALLMKQEGHNFSFNACDKKIRMLKYRYRQINEEQERAERKKPIAWEFYSRVDEMMACDPLSVKRPFKKVTPFPLHIKPAKQRKNDFGVQWSHEAILLLLELYKKYRGMFYYPGTTKASVYKKISTTMESHGHHYSADFCDKKMRSLKYRYKLIAYTTDGNERRKRKWEYYEVMRDVLAYDASQCARKIEVPDTPILNLKPPDPINMHSWTHDAIVLLIQTYSDLKPLFYNRAVKKLDVWKKVAEKLTSHGFNYPIEVCDKKMRALKYRYKLIVDEEKKGDRKGRRRWYYFQHMHRLYKNDTIFWKKHKPEKPETSPTEDETIGEETSSFEASTTQPATLPSTSATQQTTPGSAAEQLSIFASISAKSSAASTRPSTSKSVLSSYKPMAAKAKKSDRTKKSEQPSEKKKTEVEPPAWFLKFAEEQRTQMKELKELQQSALEVARERNNILKTFADILAKK
ncbi:uncharacterized protein LOC144433225 [Glandiceps talaboti]